MALVAAALLVGLATPVFADSPTLSMSPSHGGPGTTITLTGSGFLHFASVTISFNKVVQAGAATDSSGGFTVVFPAPNYPPGTYPVTVNDAANSVSVDFKLDPSSGTTSTTTTSTTTTSRTTSTTTSSIPSTTTTTTPPPTSTTTLTTTVFRTATETVVSPTTSTVTVTTAGQPSTATQTQTETKTGPGSTVTATTVVNPAASTVTVTVMGGQTSTTPGAGQSSPQPSPLSDASLYFFAGVGALILAISAGILAFRHRVNADYGKNLMSRKEET